MNKKLIKNNIIELQKETLRNILSSKGIIYRYYSLRKKREEFFSLRHLQRKHQSNHLDYLPTKYE